MWNDSLVLFIFTICCRVCCLLFVVSFHAVCQCIIHCGLWIGGAPALHCILWLHRSIKWKYYRFLTQYINLPNTPFYFGLVGHYNPRKNIKTKLMRVWMTFDCRSERDVDGCARLCFDNKVAKVTFLKSSTRCLLLKHASFFFTSSFFLFTSASAL